jgi:long-chain fatty acid transport protein
MRPRLVPLLLAFGLPCVSLFGLGIRIADQDPLATARGNAFAATADDPSAIYYNPAGITQLAGHQFQLGAYGIYLNDTFTAPGGAEYDTKDEIQLLPQFYYTYSFEKVPLSLGLGLYAPFGFALEWPDDVPFRAYAKEGRIMYVSINPVVAYRIHPTLSVAAGLTVNYSEAELTRGIFVPGDEFKFDGDDLVPGFNLGLRWQPHPQHAFGVTYRGETTMDYDGDSRTQLVVPAALVFSEPASARFRFPQYIIAGYSFRPTPKWNLEFNLDWTDWESLNTVTLHQASGDAALTFNWESSFCYEFGATHYFGEDWTVSAGYIYSENSVPDATFNPVVPDSDRHVFSLGLGRTYGRFHWDLAYQLAYGPERDVGQGPASPVTGQYEFISHAFSLAFRYQF